MHRSFRCAVVAVLPALLIAACSSDTSTPTSPSGAAGTYTLLRINGVALPAVFDVSGTDTTSATAGVVRLHANSTWAVNLTLSLRSGGQTTPLTQSDTGTFAISHDTATFTSTDLSTTTAVLSGNNVTVYANQGDQQSATVLTFQKQ